MGYLYKNNYVTKILVIIIFSGLLCLLSNGWNYNLIRMPNKNIVEYHINILTINSIFSGFALTNLGILLSITDDQLIKKLEGTDILQKRNIVIAQSIIFGAISIFLSMFWVLKVNLDFLKLFLKNNMVKIMQEFLFYLEIFSMVISILYFILSIKKMIELLSLVHVPKKRYSDEQIEIMKTKIFKETSK